jgi:hypothetical protein
MIFCGAEQMAAANIRRAVRTVFNPRSFSLPFHSAMTPSSTLALFLLPLNLETPY